MDPLEFGRSLPRLVAPPPGPRSLALAERLARVESRNVTHLTPRFPIFWEEARGANVRDVDGIVYLVLTGAFGVSAAGHGPPRVIRRIREQAGRLIHGMGDVHPPVGKVELLEALGSLAPWSDTRVILGSSGAEAMEAALKTALLATGRPGIVAFEGSYHGLTLGALAATHRDDFRGPFFSRLYPGVRFAPFPDPRVTGASARALEHVAMLLREGEGGDEMGAVVVEPIQGRAGVRLPPPGFLAELARITRRAGALLVFDEIFTGLGRTGRLFAFQHENVVPDLVCLGKGLGGGLPLSACLGPTEVMNAWPPSRGEAIHTSTFLGNPLACAAGLAFLQELEEERLVGRSRDLGEEVRGSLARSLESVPGVGEVRGRGLFLGIELVHSRTGSPLVGGAVRLAEAALQEGILVLPAGADGHVVELSPPLVITREQIEWAVPRLCELVARATTDGS